MPYIEDVLNMFLLNKLFFISSEAWFFLVFDPPLCVCVCVCVFEHCRHLRCLNQCTELLHLFISIISIMKISLLISISRSDSCYIKGRLILSIKYGFKCILSNYIYTRTKSHCSKELLDSYF